MATENLFPLPAAMLPTARPLMIVILTTGKLLLAEIMTFDIVPLRVTSKRFYKDTIKRI